MEYYRENGRLKEIWFNIFYEHGQKTYKLRSIYGKGYIRHKLFDEGDKEVALSTLDETKGQADVTFPGDFILGVPMTYFKSPKLQAVAAVSTMVSQIASTPWMKQSASGWMQSGRQVNKYIPTDMIPRDGVPW